MRGLLEPALLALLVGCSLPVPDFVAEEIDDRFCPDEGTDLTWEDFGEPFMRHYCVRCHGGMGGVSSRSYVTHESVAADAERIYVNAAGPNTTMPPGPDDPPEEAREALAEWLVCGAP